MMMYTFLTFLISFILPLLFSPISLGLWIILLAMFISINLMLLMSSWLSFITFLIYIGGLLVMFAYFVAISPNKKINMMDPMMVPTLLMSIIMFSSMKFWHLPSFNIFSMSSFNMKILLTTQYFPLLIIMGVALLVALITVVKITIRSQGALRPYHNK